MNSQNDYRSGEYKNHSVEYKNRSGEHKNRSGEPLGAHCNIVM